MSKKINILSIVSGHYSTLRNSNGSFNILDIITFMILPFICALLAVFYIKAPSTETISLLVNFGSIFTALLLSVLVLIFDQENKADEQYEKYLILKEELDMNPQLSITTARSWVFNKNLDEGYSDKKELLKQLYFNISFSIIVSLLLVLFCLLYSNACLVTNLAFKLYLVKFTTLCISFLMITIFLNILMIVKRMHVLLTN